MLDLTPGGIASPDETDPNSLDWIVDRLHGQVTGEELAPVRAGLSAPFTNLRITCSKRWPDPHSSVVNHFVRVVPSLIFCTRSGFVTNALPCDALAIPFRIMSRVLQMR